MRRELSVRKVCVVIGTRPEAIKMAPVILALREHPHNFNVTVCSTGQHTTMLDGALVAFGIRPDVEFFKTGYVVFDDVS